MTQEHGDKQEMKGNNLTAMETYKHTEALNRFKAKVELIEAFLKGEKIEINTKSYGWQHTIDPDWSAHPSAYRIMKKEIKVGDTVRNSCGDIEGIVRAIFYVGYTKEAFCTIELRGLLAGLTSLRVSHLTLVN